MSKIIIPCRYDPTMMEPKEETPVVICKKCEQGVWEGEKLYNGMCPDCFSDYIESLLAKDPDRIAEALDMRITRL